MTPEEFVEHYENYLIGDIAAMMEKADQKDEQGKLGNQMAVPIALSIFSGLDIFGFLMRNTETFPKNICNELKDSSVNIAYAMLWYDFGFPSFNIEYVPGASVKKRCDDKNYKELQETALYKFIKKYRHGMAHTFFPKSLDISNSKDYETAALLFKINDILTLNVRKFCSNFRDFLTAFKKNLSSDTQFYRGINENINRAFKQENDIIDFMSKISLIPKFDESFIHENCTATPKTTSYPK